MSLIDVSLNNADAGLRRLQMSKTQEFIWITHLVNPGAPMTVSAYIRLDGPVSYDLLERAMAHCADETESLQVKFAEPTAGTLPVQYLDSRVELTLPVRDFGEADRPEAEALAWMRAQHCEFSYDTTLLRYSLLRIAADRHFLFVVAHHIVIDGFAAFSAMQRIADLYSRLHAGDAVTRDDRRGLINLETAEADYRAGARYVADREHWADRMTRMPAPVALGARAAVAGATNLYCEVPLDNAVTDMISRAGMKVSDLTAVAYALWASRISRTQRLTVTLPVTARTTPGTLRSAGCQSNLVPVEFDLADHRTAADVVEQFSAQSREIMRHQRFPAAEILALSGADRSASRYFGPMLNIMMYTGEFVVGDALGTMHFLSTGPIDDMALTLHRVAGGELRLALEANPAVHRHADVAAHVRRIALVLERLARNPAAPLGDIDILDEQDRDLIAEYGRASTAAHPAVLADLMAAAVAAAPESPAVIDGSAVLTYRELDELSNRVGRSLIAAGIGPEDMVALAIPRSMSSLIATWAIAKTGAAAVPIDSGYPEERVRQLVADSGARHGIRVQAGPADLPESVTWLLLEELIARPASADHITDADRVRPLRLEHPAYVTYTSGSTGRPKGVVVSQVGLAGFCAEQQRRYRTTVDSRILYAGSLSFDITVAELLMAIGSSSALVVCPAEVYGGRELAEVIDGNAVTHMLVTPSVLATLDPGTVSTVRVVIVGGESFSGEVVRRWTDAIPGLDFVNSYGPTEATVFTTMSAPLVPGGSLNVGPPMRGTRAWVLDARLRPVPVGVAGELYIAGVHLGRGYLGQPGRSAERFVACRYGDGERMYRTGDIVRWAAGGDLEYVSRADSQVKVRGFRIELAEIDSVVTAFDAVTHAATVTHTTAAGTTSLICYIAVAQPGRLDHAELTGYVAERLPAHMVPALFVELTSVPLTSTGKLDRAALPAPELPEVAYRAPRTAIEIAVAEVFAEVLGLERVGLDDAFLSLGGDSILAIILVSRAKTRGLALTARQILGQHTVEELAAAAMDVAAQPDSAALDHHPLASPAAADLERWQRRYRQVTDVWPLTGMQAGMWFHAQHDAVDVYTVQFVLTLAGSVDTARLRRSAEAVVARHDNLRVAFTTDELGQPVQLVVDPVSVPWTEHPETLTHDAAAGIAERDRLAPFDLSTPPLLRFTLVPVENGQWTFIATLHHILIDGWSLPILLRELLANYAAPESAGVLTGGPSYRDYLRWLRRSDPIASAAVWTTALAGAEPTLLAGPAHDGRADTVPHRFTTTFGADRTAAINAAAAACGTTPNTVLQVALGLLLARATGRVDAVLGSTSAGRPADLAGVESMVGLFLTTTPVWIAPRADEPIGAFLARVHREQTDLREHQWDGLAHIQAAAGAGALFDTLLVFESFPLDTTALLREAGDVDGMSVLEMSARDATHYPLTVVVHPGADIGVDWSYLPNRFGENDIRARADELGTILDAMLANPAAPVRAIGAGSGPASSALTGTPWPAASDATLASAFAAGVEDFPDLPAVLDSGQTLSYREFAARVNRTARALIERGAGPDVAVGILLERSTDLLVAVHAVHAAGAAYVPLDPEYPQPRIEQMVRAANAVCVVTSAKFAGSLTVPVLRIDEFDAAGYADVPIGAQERRAPLRPDNLAYILFTSGSTGAPKGVGVTHRAIMNRLAWMQSAYRIGTGDVVLHKTPVTFDVSVWELFWPLHTGAAVSILEPGAHRDPLRIAQRIRDDSVTVAHFVPSMLAAFLDTVDAAGTSARGSLRDVITSGEALPAGLARRARAAVGARVHNLYGPTEAAVDVTFHEVVDADLTSVPIGAPVHNTGTYVLDSWLRPVAAGVPGELYLAGVQLARGYVGRADLTADRFVADPFAAGERLYRTGDLVRCTTAGALEYLGRTDFQIKIRGIRVEPGEIEAVLTDIPAVQRSAVAGMPDAHGRQRLVGYLVPAPGAEPDLAAVRAHLAQRLPAQLVPQSLVVLDALPLTSSGKLARAQLPAPDTAGSQPSRPAQDGPEQVLCRLFAEVLGVAEIGVEESFFDRGGDSIAAIQLVNRARREHLRFSPAEVFDHRTPAALAAVAVVEADRATPVLDGVPTGPVPITPIVARYAERARSCPRDGFHQSLLLKVPAALNFSALIAAVAAIVEHHDVLRANWVRAVNGGSLEIADHAAPAQGSVRRVAIDGDPTAAELAEMVRDTMDLLDATAGATLHAVWLDAGPNRPGRLLLLAHHLVIDGVSWRILLPDLVSAYTSLAAGSAAVLEPVGTPLRVWAAELAALARTETVSAELEHWRAVVGGTRMTVADRAFDIDVDTQRTARFLGEELSNEDAEALLTTLPARFNVAVDDVLLTALGAAVTRLQREHGRPVGPLVTETERHGRDEELVPGADLSRTLGWFTAVVPVRLDASAVAWDGVVAGGDAVADLIRQVKEQVRTQRRTDLAYGLLRFVNPDTAAILAAADPVEIGFNYLGRLGASADLAGWEFADATRPFDSGAQDGFPLDHLLEAVGGAQVGGAGTVLRFGLGYAAQAISDQVAARLLRLWTDALQGFIRYAATDRVAGTTPSDHDLVSVSQDELDEWETEFTDLAFE
ncbi:amino acid adenylation domain-containing protein [Nocardia sp. NPDC020380]|uniref:amino acid adenylation domain-containing protein n=1 Tax=Nocardia sp. NPDC020380 TaxID=3364309 RepID=UPI0037A04A48